MVSGTTPKAMFGEDTTERMGLSKTGQLIDVLYLQAPKKSDTLAYLNTGPKRIEATLCLNAE
jgi:hypothetical protein